MGYTTEFYGSFSLDKPLAPEHSAYLVAFSNTRRVRRSAKLAAKRDDPVRIAAGLPIGVEGGYFVGSQAPYGQESTRDVLDGNVPPKGQPGLWCQWGPEGGNPCSEIGWDGGEKFYNATQWLEYLIFHFLRPWGYVVNGAVEWSGEDSDDRGLLDVRDNVVEELQASRVFVRDGDKLMYEACADFLQESGKFISVAEMLRRLYG